MKAKNSSQSVDWNNFVIPFAIAAVVVFAVAISFIQKNSVTPPETLGTVSRTIGYIGCSNTWMSVSGYQSVTGTKHRFWKAYDTGGKTVGSWANASDPIWSSYDTQVATYGQPSKVWIQLCENVLNANNTYDQVKMMIANLKVHSPLATYYVSGINSYNPTTLCSYMGTDYHGYTDTITWRNQAVADGLSLMGPDMGPLTASLVQADGCHPNAAGRVNPLGQQLVNFFDPLP